LFEPVWIGAGNVNEMQVVTQWVAQRIWPDDPGKDFGPSCAMVVVDGDQLIAAVICHNWDEQAKVVEISAAGDNRRWMTRPVLRALFSRIFDGFNVQTCVARLDADNAGLVSIFQRFGFTTFRLPNLRGRGKDEIVCLLTDDAWRHGRFYSEN
jgi:RimJ/RimL family protein N-acetyltransferase